MNDAVPQSVYFDANAFVEMFEKDSSIAALIRTLIVDVEPIVLQRHTSELTLAELLVKPMSDRNDPLVQLYTGFVQTSDLLNVAPISRKVLCTAAMTRADDGAIRLPDAIHIATALEQECGWFVTGDKRLRLSPQAKKPFQIIDPYSPDFPDFVNRFAS